jgi:uncharacterized protein (TIGR00661 family)
MKILYGVQGTGNGHLTRSLKVINRLEALGHEVDLVISAQWGNIHTGRPVLRQFKGFTFKHNADGSINKMGTGLSMDLVQFYKDTKFDLAPYDTIFVDFEPVIAWAAKRQKREVIGISNQYAFLSSKVPRPKKKDYAAEFVFKNFAPVTHPIGLYFDVYDDFIYKPIIRDEVITMTLSNEGHYTVYIPDVELNLLVADLTKASHARFHIFTNKVTENTEYKNCLLHKPDPTTFMHSFASSQGIITRCGFQTTAEALYTGKKLMAIPQVGQYEQACNAVALEQLGATVGTLADLQKFIEAPTPFARPWDDPVDAILARVLG